MIRRETPSEKFFYAFGRAFKFSSTFFIGSTTFSCFPIRNWGKALVVTITFRPPAFESLLITEVSCLLSCNAKGVIFFSLWQEKTLLCFKTAPPSVAAPYTPDPIAFKSRFYLDPLLLITDMPASQGLPKRDVLCDSSLVCLGFWTTFEPNDFMSGPFVSSFPSKILSPLLFIA